MATETRESLQHETLGGTTAADRVADVLLLFARSDGPLGVSRIARSLSLSKAVVHRILQSLVSRSLVQSLPGGSAYVLGPAVASLAARAWSQHDVRSIASPVLRQLRDDTRETTTLSVLVANERIYLDQFESPQEIKMVVEIGPRFPLHSGASSRAILAHLPSSYVEQALRQLSVLRPDLDADAFLADLEKTRRLGWTASFNERQTGAASIAAPFFDSMGNVLGSVSACGPIFRYSGGVQSEQAELVVAAAREITERMRSLTTARGSGG